MADDIFSRTVQGQNGKNFANKKHLDGVNCSLKLHFVFQDANFENRNNFLQLKILFCNLKSIFVIQISQTFTFLRLCAYNSVTDS